MTNPSISTAVLAMQKFCRRIEAEIDQKRIAYMILVWKTPINREKMIKKLFLRSFFFPLEKEINKRRGKQTN